MTSRDASAAYLSDISLQGKVDRILLLEILTDELHQVVFLFSMGSFHHAYLSILKREEHKYM